MKQILIAIAAPALLALAWLTLAWLIAQPCTPDSKGATIGEVMLLAGCR